MVWDSEQQLDSGVPDQHLPLGNDPGTRWWQGSLTSLPAYQVQPAQPETLTEHGSTHRTWDVHKVGTWVTQWPSFA